MSTIKLPPVWSVDQFAKMAAEYFEAHLTCYLRGMGRVVTTWEAVEKVVTREYPVEEGAIDVFTWVKRHKKLGDGPVEGHTIAWEQTVFSPFGGDYAHAFANYVCTLVAAAVRERLENAPEFAATRAESDSRHEHREAMTAGAMPLGPSGPTF